MIMQGGMLKINKIHTDKNIIEWHVLNARKKCIQRLLTKYKQSLLSLDGKVVYKGFEIK